MAVITMASSNLLNQLTTDFPAIHFVASDLFQWSNNTQTVHYNPLEPTYSLLLLHETAHATLGHNEYYYDIDLLKLERAAWNETEQLAKKYAVTFDETVVEDALDSYREWLHARSLCPSCGLLGVQESASTYACVACHAKWRVNHAKHCGLKRTKLPQKHP